MSTFTDPELTKLVLRRTPLIDVRAPIEFNAVHAPNSANLPLMSDEERHEVGLCYKAHGQAPALELGHKLVGDKIKSGRVDAWLNFIERNPTAQVMCFRGGLRSQIACQWLEERGVLRTPLAGGHKRLRQFYLSWLNDGPLPQLIRIAGFTGSGKTELLLQLKNGLDLEELAQHRGSVFGDRGPQPTQATFESAIAAYLLAQQKLVVEDESAMIGALRIPRRFHQHMQQAPMVVLETPFEDRLRNIHRDYVLAHGREYFLNSAEKLATRLGGLRARELREGIERAYERGPHFKDHEGWMSFLLNEYYDPAYRHGLKKQGAKILLQGSAKTLKEFLSARI